MLIKQAGIIFMAALLGASANSWASTEIDSDGDGVSDAIEHRHGLDPHKPYDVWRDNDGDHLPDIQEFMLGLDTGSKDNDIYSNKRLLVIGALADIYSISADEAQVDALSAEFQSPVALYTHLLDEHHLAVMGFIGRVYQAILMRQPDIDGARYYYHMLLQGMSKLQMVQQFLGSKEFEHNYGELSDKAFINRLFVNLVGQSAQAQDIDFFLDILHREGVSRAHMMLRLIDSPDYIANFELSNRLDVLSVLLTAKVSDKTPLYRHWLQKEGHYRSIVADMLASDDFLLNRTGGKASIDSDGDGKSDGLEFIEGTDLYGKDNDVLTDNRAFVAQVLRDVHQRNVSYDEITFHLGQLEGLRSRSQWLLMVASTYDFDHMAALASALDPAGLARFNRQRFNRPEQAAEFILHSPTFAQRFY